MGSSIIIFTLNGCSHCKLLKDKLNELNIDFTEMEVTQHKITWEQVLKQTKIDYLPTIFINKDGTGTGPVFCPERDFNNPDEAVNLIRKNINIKKGDK